MPVKLTSPLPPSVPPEIVPPPMLAAEVVEKLAVLPVPLMFRLPAEQKAPPNVALPENEAVPSMSVVPSWVMAPEVTLRFPAPLMSLLTLRLCVPSR